jgi:L-serine dehydratase
MNIFDILGPVMVGPSSSHTAGAVRIGRIARQLLGGRPDVARIHLHGSFAATGAGHGTDRAIVAGLMGMQPDDIRIPDSFEIAKKDGMQFTIDKVDLKDAHPNTALLELETSEGNKLKIRACSVGGGRIQVNQLDDIDVSFTGETNTLIVYNKDKPGLVAEVTSTMACKKVNIATMQIFRDKRGGIAVMVVETDQSIPRESLSWLRSMDGIYKVTYIDVNQ